MSNAPEDVRLIVVCTLPAEEAGKVFANMCAAIENCMVMDKADWKLEDGVAVFQGTALLPLSGVTSRLYSDEATATRVRSISFQDYSRR